MSDAPIHMWSYWRDKYGHAEALREYYPYLLKSNTQLTYALAQIENALAAIDSVFNTLEDEG